MNNSKPTTTRTKIINNLIRIFGEGPYTRTQLTKAALITNGRIKTLDEYDWKEHRGYYGCAFSAYGCDHFYRPIEETKAYQGDERYLSHDRDAKVYELYAPGYFPRKAIELGVELETPFGQHAVEVLPKQKPQPQPKKVSLGSTQNRITEESDMVILVPGGQTAVRKTFTDLDRYVASYKEAIRNGDDEVATIFGNRIINLINAR